MVAGRTLQRETRVRVRHQSKTVRGSFQPMGFVVILMLFFAGGGYLYSVNQNAVQGFHMRKLEKEISRLKDANANLQIAEAEKRSLSRLQSSLENTSMRKIEEIKIIQKNTKVAFR